MVAREADRLRAEALGRSDLECEDCTTKADSIIDRFLAHLPELRSQVRLDLRAAYEGDPAASGVDEILFCYPGTYAITVYRIAHALLAEGAATESGRLLTSWQITERLVAAGAVARR